jgi:hypothetical protein
MFKVITSEGRSKKVVFFKAIAKEVEDVVLDSQVLLLTHHEY